MIRSAIVALGAFALAGCAQGSGRSFTKDLPPDPGSLPMTYEIIACDGAALPGCPSIFSARSKSPFYVPNVGERFIISTVPDRRWITERRFEYVPNGPAQVIRLGTSTVSTARR